MPNTESKERSLGHTSWQSVDTLAIRLWVACAQRVDGLWRNSGQLTRSIHSCVVTHVAVWENSRFMHGLYKFYTQVFPTQNSTNTLLLFTIFYTSSTGPIKRTKRLRKDYL